MKDLLENNKLIAEFMSLEKVKEYDDEDNWFYVPDRLHLNNEFSYKNEVDYTKSNMLPYNCSYDWLMPVVEKIEKLGETKDTYGKLVDITTTYIKISKGCANGDFTIDLKLPANSKLSKLEALYKAVVLFIKWYNENNKK